MYPHNFMWILFSHPSHHRRKGSGQHHTLTVVRPFHILIQRRDVFQRSLLPIGSEDSQLTSPCADFNRHGRCHYQLSQNAPIRFRGVIQQLLLFLLLRFSADLLGLPSLADTHSHRLIHPEVESFVGTDAWDKVQPKRLSHETSFADVEISFKRHYVPAFGTLCQEGARRSMSDPNACLRLLHRLSSACGLHQGLVLQSLRRSHPGQRHHHRLLFESGDLR